MGLILKNKTYIKIDNTDGSVVFYYSREDRDKEKRATKSSVILAEYTKRCQQLANDIERQYYDSVAWEKEYNELVQEMNIYCTALNEVYSKDNYTKREFPIMQKTFPDINDSCPRILCRIDSGELIKDTLEESYLAAKEIGIFGEEGNDC